ncbi:MAG: type II toxin-antitoxin system RelE/ParE family toxin [Moorea sp. SIOASIH]|uniref:type II toxin-antitoxin system RelE/ParE family toxin n=1 Tax=Moorena sp. SIOASIH TaxID=2607817 RepID=UPI0013BD5809|nr:type II toxin-antitoxin system RelE/ParE family toxin [Moorena sp. SIOASIH]NEO36604.1 type II toxin-antitoxin system RelE/ParE family toxin [Moorena sp. SIOASIH]
MTFSMQKSALFMRQWRDYAQNYKNRAGVDVAERFIAAVEQALDFIKNNPYACALYDAGEGYEDLQVYQFRKWRLQGFPHAVLFRLEDNATILVEVLYAHKMHIPSRLMRDMEGI